MTRVFTDDGSAVPVTVLDVANNRVTQIKTPETDGYAAVQVTYGKRRPSRVSKPQAGHLAKAGVESGVMLKEFPVSADALAGLKPGDVVGADTFEPGQFVDVTGTTKGHGFTGVVKRHHFGGNRASHGNPVTTRAPGSIDMAQDRPRVPGQAHGRPARQRRAHGADADGRPRGQGAWPPARQGRGPGRGRRCGDRASLGEDAGEEGGVTMELKLIDEQGQPASTLAASDALFARDYNEALVHQVVTAYQANGRQGTRAQKSRGEINKSHKKPWKQKGTGRARAGQANSPLWRGGGRIFPSSPDENFTQKVNRKMYRAGIASILSQLVREERLKVIESIAADTPKTGQFAKKMKGLGLEGTVLVVTDRLDENVFLASRNLPNVLVVEAREVDPVSLVRFNNVLLTKAAVGQFEEMLG
jgi:large subunit ribosomal protein L4